MSPRSSDRSICCSPSRSQACSFLPACATGFRRIRESIRTATWSAGGCSRKTSRCAWRRPSRARKEFDPHQFVGRMWVGADLGTPQERYYPKYPIGLPALVATSLWIGGDTWGPIIVYWINPVAMTLAVLATFLLVRLVAGSFWCCAERSSSRPAP